MLLPLDGRDFFSGAHLPNTSVSTPRMLDRVLVMSVVNSALSALVLVMAAVHIGRAAPTVTQASSPVQSVVASSPADASCERAAEAEYAWLQSGCRVEAPRTHVKSAVRSTKRVKPNRQQLADRDLVDPFAIAPRNQSGGHAHPDRQEMALSDLVDPFATR